MFMNNYIKVCHCLESADHYLKCHWLLVMISIGHVLPYDFDVFLGTICMYLIRSCMYRIRSCMYGMRSCMCGIRSCMYGIKWCFVSFMWFRISFIKWLLVQPSHSQRQSSWSNHIFIFPSFSVFLTQICLIK